MGDGSFDANDISDVQFPRKTLQTTKSQDKRLPGESDVAPHHVIISSCFKHACMRDIDHSHVSFYCVVFQVIQYIHS